MMRFQQPVTQQPHRLRVKKPMEELDGLANHNQTKMNGQYANI